jgi:hypothetical protein
MFSEEEISRAEDAFDLLSRVKSTDQAEMIAPVLFSYDGIAKNAANATIIDARTNEEITNGPIPTIFDLSGLRSAYNVANSATVKETIEFQILEQDNEITHIFIISPEKAD